MPRIILNGKDYITGGGGGGTPYDDTDIKNDLQDLTNRVGIVETDKANVADVYTKTEVDDAIAQAQIGGTADLSDYAKTADVDLKLADKANKTELDAYTKTNDLTNLLADKADKTDLDDLVTSTEMQDAIVQAQIGGTALPTGGTTGQVLAKVSEADGDVEWKDVQGGGSTITVDDVMSDDSENPVQNKVAKKYVDDTLIGMTASANFVIENGFGKLRYYNNKFQYYDDNTSSWVDTVPNLDNSVIINLTPGIVQKFVTICNPDTLNIEIKLWEPSDVIVDGQALCIIEKVIVRRKKDSFPTDENDGDHVFTVKRNEFGRYKDTPFIDNVGGALDEVYYYKAFPVSTNGVVNYMEENNRKCKIKRYQLYGFRLDQREGGPEAMVQYLADADNTYFFPVYMDYARDTFNYGDWEDAWFIKKLKPCMLNYDGTVAYELNKDDYSLKTDGSPSDITDQAFGGNVMIGFPKIYWKIVDNGDDTADVFFSDQKLDSDYVCWCNINEAGEEIDYFYMAAYNGSLIDSKIRSLSGKTMDGNHYYATDFANAQKNNVNTEKAWNIELFIDRTLINLLLLLIGKSTDTQDIFGNGNETYGGNTGLLDDKGLFYGQNTSHNIKVFGIENYWGNKYRYGAGCVLVGGAPKVKLTHGMSDGSTEEGYNTTGSGYISLSNVTIASAGYISKMHFSNNIMFPSETVGSASTRYCDYLILNKSGTRYIAFASYNKAQTGAFYLNFNGDSSSSQAYTGSTLSCKPLNPAP